MKNRFFRALTITTLGLFLIACGNTSNTVSTVPDDRVAESTDIETSNDIKSTVEPTAEPIQEAVTDSENDVEPTANEADAITTPEPDEEPEKEITVEPTEEATVTSTAEPTEEVTVAPTEPAEKPVETKPVETTPTPTTKPVETAATPTTKPVEVKATSISAKANGSYYVGDTLKASDFTITVKMSDGSTKTNPAGFSVSPLKLSSTKNTLTASYGGVSTTFNVNATQKATPTPTTAPVTTTVSDKELSEIYVNPTDHFRKPYPSIKYNQTSYDGGEICFRALWEIGQPYVAGGKSHDGFDCSGLVWFVYHRSGIEIPTSATGQAKCGTKIPIWDAKMGDIVVYEYTDGSCHTGIYYSESHMIDARMDKTLEGCNGVQIHPLYDALVEYKNLKKIYAVRVGNNTCYSKMFVTTTDDIENNNKYIESKVADTLRFFNMYYDFDDTTGFNSEPIENSLASYYCSVYASSAVPIGWKFYWENGYWNDMDLFPNGDISILKKYCCDI